MLQDLGFTRRDIGNDEVWQHRELDLRNLLLHDFDGAYHFVLRDLIYHISKYNETASTKIPDIY